MIHGNYTKSGKPLLASDPHLSTDANCFWILQHLEWKDSNNETRYVVGGAVPGIPLVEIGRTKHLTWGVTNPVTDVSDLFYETVNEMGTQYLVDGEWRDFKVVNHTIKVKGRAKPVKFQLKYTYRGPVMDSLMLSHAQVIFGPG